MFKSVATNESATSAAKAQALRRQKELTNALERMEKGTCDWALITSGPAGTTTLLCSDPQAVMLLSDALYSMIGAEHAYSSTVH